MWWNVAFVHVLHSLRFLKLANLLDVVHQVAAVHVLHDKVQTVLPKGTQRNQERMRTLQTTTLQGFYRSRYAPTCLGDGTTAADLKRLLWDDKVT